MTDFRPTIGLLVSATLLSCALSAQERAEQASGVRAVSPTYEPGKGPVIGYDEAHKNTTTYARYPEGIKAFQDDGYRPRPFTDKISAASLSDIGILVISDPQVTLSDDEVSALVAWVKAGGSLLLVLDHTASLQTKLTASLGVRNWPGNSAGAGPPGVLNIIFWRSEFFPSGAPEIALVGSGGGRGYQTEGAVLAKHAITEGRGPSERIRRVVTRSGSAFEAVPGGVPLLTLPQDARLGAAAETASIAGLLGDRKFDHTAAAGWLQGAVTEFGKGRVALFADSAVAAGGTPNNQYHDTAQFVLNVMHWFSRVL